MSSSKRELAAETVRDRIIRQSPRPCTTPSIPTRLPLVTSPAAFSPKTDKVKIRNRFQHSQNNMLCYASNVQNVPQICSTYVPNSQEVIHESSVHTVTREGIDRNSKIEGTSETSQHMSKEGQGMFAPEKCSRCNSDSILYDSSMKRCLNCGMFSFQQTILETALSPKTFYDKETTPTQNQTPDARLHHSNEQWKSAKKPPAPKIKIQRRKRLQKIKIKVCLTISSDEEDGQKESTKKRLDDEEENSQTSNILQQSPAEGPTEINHETDDSDSSKSYKIPKLSDRMKQQGGKVNLKKDVTNQQPNGCTVRPLLSLCSPEKKFELPVKRIQLGTLSGKGLTPLSLQNSTLRIEVECTFNINEGNKKKIMNEKYKLALSSVEVSQVLLNFEKEPLIISVVPSKRYSDIVNQALSKCILDSQNEDPSKRQIVFFIDYEIIPFKKLLEQSLPDLQRISQVSTYSQSDIERLLSCIGHSANGYRPYDTRNISSPKVLKNVKNMFVYPAAPQKGGIAITTADVECLKPGIYLNDTIIDFYLRYLYEEKLSDKQRQKTYIFNSYFYTRLSKKTFADSSKSQNPAERMHTQVKKWTRDVNIFEKDYIIIPVNEHAHWFLVIICFPSKVENDEGNTEDETSTSSDSIEVVQVATNTEEKTGNDQEEKMETDEEACKMTKEEDKDVLSSENDTQAGDNIVDKLPRDSSSTVKKDTADVENMNSVDSKVNPSPFQQPCILIFDSLVSGGRSRVFSNLRHYLTLEWKEKKSKEEPDKIFTKNNIKGCFPKIPLQSNDCDCGVYILQFAESFFENPIISYKFPIRKETWFTKSHVDGKRERIQELIKEMDSKFSQVKPMEKTN